MCTIEFNEWRNEPVEHCFPMGIIYLCMCMLYHPINGCTNIRLHHHETKNSQMHSIVHLWVLVLDLTIHYEYACTCVSVCFIGINQMLYSMTIGSILREASLPNPSLQQLNSFDHSMCRMEEKEKACFN